MKIAFASNNGETIAAHFGHCACFLVLSVEDERISGREVRQPANDAGAVSDKHGPGDCHCHETPGTGHKDRLAMLSDCDAVVTLGMGPRAVSALEKEGVEAIILPNPMKPEDAALAHARGELRKGQTSGECCRHESR